MGSKLGAGIATAGKWALGIGTAAIAVGAAVGGLVMKATDAASEIDDMSQRAGMAAEEFQKYAYAAKLSGMETETLEKAMIKQQKAFSDAKDGSSAMAEAYERLGININEIDSSGEAFDAVINSLASMTDETERNTLANDIFGKTYAEISPLLNEGAAGIAKLKQEAVDMGAVMSNGSVAAGAKFGDMIDSTKMMIGGLVNTFGTELMPMFISVLAWIQSKAPDIKATVGEVVDFIKIIVAGFTTFWQENGDTITAIATTIFEILKEVVQIGMDIIKGIIDVVMGIIQGDWSRVWNGLTGILNGAFELIKMALRLALDGLKAILTGAVTSFKEAGKTIFQGVWDGMKEMWTSLSTWVSEKVTWLLDKLAFWRSSKAEMGGDDEDVNGSHANGLAYVPFNGYKAQLHKGERVLTAQENQQLNTVRNQKSGDTFNFYSPKAIDEKEAARLQRRARREMAFGV